MGWRVCLAGTVAAAASLAQKSATWSPMLTSLGVCMLVVWSAMITPRLVRVKRGVFQEFIIRYRLLANRSNVQLQRGKVGGAG